MLSSSESDGRAVILRRLCRSGMLILCTVGILLLVGCSERVCIEPGSEEPTITYAFRTGWSSDCGADVTLRHFWYFECRGDDVTHIGEWDPSVQDTFPAWCNEAKISMHCFDGIGSACSPSFGPFCADTSKTPRENKEAEEMALWLSGSLVAPDDLYDTMLKQLSLIRDDHADQIPQLRDVVFEPHWASNEIRVRVTDEAVSRYEAGQYNDLDSLNASLKLMWMSYREAGSFLLRYNGRYHFHRLREMYTQIPSVVSVYPPGPGRPCSPPGVYPWYKSEEP